MIKNTEESTKYDHILLEKLKFFCKLIYKNDNYIKYLYERYVSFINTNVDILSLFGSFLLYKCAIDKDPLYLEFIENNEISCENIYLSNCNLTTDSLEKILPFIIHSTDIKNIYLDYNKITRIPIDFGIDSNINILLDGNPLDFSVALVNPEKYITNLHLENMHYSHPKNFYFKRMLESKYYPKWKTEYNNLHYAKNSPWMTSIRKKHTDSNGLQRIRRTTRRAHQSGGKTKRNTKRNTKKQKNIKI
jgi:hypothetical protein